MTHDQQFLVGCVVTLLFLAAVVGGPLFLALRMMPRINRARRRRQIETAMRLGVLDGELIQEVGDKLYREREGQA
ncbi:hypothetical protein [Streptomyces sp. AC555_RSS877]|uniref:hypothetical protein n=1 Tax=Streptomyces sp. AC555_RSS877 TaxID=2823688 RepID=UPI001C278490|nr:hypothetical protein [Streptomyces sp. AC555_RSS877]